MEGISVIQKERPWLTLLLVLGKKTLLIKFCVNQVSKYMLSEEWEAFEKYVVKFV